MILSTRRSAFVAMSLVCFVALAGSAAIAQNAKDSKPATPPAQNQKDAKPAAGHDGQPAMQLPPGWTPEDMQACMAAGIPGKMHEHMAKSFGVWHGQTTM